MRVKCHAQDHNTMSPARARTQTTRSRDEYINHDATVLPIRGVKAGLIAFEDRRFVFSQCELLLSLIVVGFACPEKLIYSHTNVHYNVVVVCLL